MGTIRKRGRNYEIDANHKGVRVRKIVGPNKRIAKEVLAEIEGKLVRREYGLDKKDALVSLVFERYLSYADSNMAAASARRYRNAIDRFNEFLDSRPNVKRSSQLNTGVMEQFRQVRLSSSNPPKTKSMNFEHTLVWIFRLPGCG